MMDKIKKTILKSPAGKLWENIGIQHHHGINIPLFSIHTQNSCGIGEILDLIPLIDWCHQVKMDVIQLLPLNDSATDPSPYNAMSSCAINPLFISLHALPYMEKSSDLKEELLELKQLTSKQRVTYNDIQSRKFNWLRNYFDNRGSKLLKTREFKQFVAENSWLQAYALFKVLKDRLEQHHWMSWPEDLKKMTPKRFDDLVSHHQKEMTFYIALQYLCFMQLKQVRDHAASAKIYLKGDIPILISPDSADVWHYTPLFNLELCAGAPPDAYNKEGQYWGFPLFNWDAIKKEEYNWWKQRLHYASHFYDIYRLDHVVGFFRIWGIPLNRPCKEGKFLPEDPSRWISQGKEILKVLLASCPMLPIAEDLGTVPPEVRVCLTELGICGTKVMRWERRWEKDQSFIPLQEYPPISMTCVSTHDLETLQLWWKNNPKEVKEFAAFKHWNPTPELTKEQRKAILWDSHHTQSLFHINLLQEYLALFPELVWQNPEDERINVPGIIQGSNWTYRYRPSLEEMLSHEGLQREIHEILFGNPPQVK